MKLVSVWCNPQTAAVVWTSFIGCTGSACAHKQYLKICLFSGFSSGSWINGMLSVTNLKLHNLEPMFLHFGLEND